MKLRTNKTTKKTGNINLRDINGLVLIAAVLGATVLLGGVSEAKFRTAEAQLAKTKIETKIAHCPIGQYANSTTAVQ